MLKKDFRMSYLKVNEGIPPEAQLIMEVEGSRKYK